MTARLKFILGSIIVILLIFFVRSLGTPDYVVLTFNIVDQAPEQIINILEVLDKNNINATFFILGDWAKNNTNLTKKISEKYEIASLGMTNTRLVIANLTYEIIDSKLLLENITNNSVAGFRSMSADLTDDIYLLIAKNYVYDSSTIDSYSWFWPSLPEGLISKPITTVFLIPMNDKYAFSDFYYFIARKSHKNAVFSFTNTAPLEIDYLINHYNNFKKLGDI